MNSTFKNAQMRFLKALKDLPDGARRRDLPMADRENDLVRQKSRRSGWCCFENRGDGARWFLTADGEAALREFLKRPSE